MDERAIGDNIRNLRRNAKLTVTELARRAGLDKSTLSKIERGSTSPPISTLIRIAEALDRALAEFFVDPDSKPRFVFTRKGEGRIITRDGTRHGYSYEALALDMRGKRAEPFLLTIQPGDPPGHFQHGGDEFIYMLSGRMEFTIGEQKFIMRAGDSIYFDGTQEHMTRIIGKRPARFICNFILDRPREWQGHSNQKSSRRTASSMAGGLGEVHRKSTNRG